MSTRVLFLCPHAAGKSLAAATYFRAAAERLNLETVIDVAGPEPDERNIPAVVAALEADGHPIAWQPRRVAASDAERADIVVSIGCERGSIPTTRAIVEWDVPLLSDDLDGCLSAIRNHAEALAARLAQSGGRKG
ncbi:MAG: hypothetical protein K5924_03780 [Chloroflexi bacterium]|nr:hypothetical protein [Chloroflexota bacterium]